MPCDTPPPPSPMENANEDNEEELDDSMYDFIDDVEDLVIIDDDDDGGGGVEDDAIVTFDGHKQPVFCCSFDKSDQYAVSGGQDDTAFVWKVEDKSIKFECTGHSDSVTAASFSSDAKYVATGDMNGLIQVWNVDDGTVIWDFEAAEVTWLKWLKKSNTLYAGCSDGNCWTWTIPEGDIKILANPAVSCNAGCISHDDEKLATGYSDGVIKFWTLSDSNLLATVSGPTGHQKSIIMVKYNADSSLLITGSEDGSAKIIKTSDFKVLWTLIGCESSQHEHETVSIEDAAFCNVLPYVVIGTNCGILSIWDMDTKIKRAHIATTNSIIRIICDKSAPIVYAANGDGTLQAYDVRTGLSIKFWFGHKAAILDLALSSDCNLLLTASDDHKCKIFQRGLL